MSTLDPHRDLTQAITTLLAYAGLPMTVRELRERAGLPVPLFNQALDELEQQGRVTWTNDDLMILPANTPQP